MSSTQTVYRLPQIAYRLNRRGSFSRIFVMICLLSPTWLVLTTGFGCNAQDTAAKKSTPRPIENWYDRVERALQTDKVEETMQELDAAVKKYPDNGELLSVRGSLKFRSGKIAESIEDFDKSIQLSPESKPFLWQRGIALYYAKRYQDGLDQFAVHREVNPNDVENAFWHFLCNVRLNGLEASQKDVLLAGFDRRVPMMEVQKLIQGKITVDDLVAATEKPSAGPSGRFYGYLYLGLYFDALGDKEKTRLWLQKCVDQKVDGYMGDVAKIHLKLL